MRIKEKAEYIAGKLEKKFKKPKKYWNLLEMTKTIFQKSIGRSVVIIFVGAIILYTYPLIGLWGQIKPQKYQKTNPNLFPILEFPHS